MTRDFVLTIERLAIVSSHKPEELLNAWREYCHTCRAWDQSPTLPEFCRWQGLPWLEAA